MVTGVQTCALPISEGDYGWHGKAPNAEQYEKARAELSARVAELEGK